MFLMYVILWDYNSYRFSHDLSLLLFFRNNLLSSPLATLNEPFFSLCFFVCNSVVSCASSGFCLSLIWLRIPANSSSTWWFNAAEVSAYLQSNLRAVDLASTKETKTHQNKTPVVIAISFNSHCMQHHCLASNIHIKRMAQTCPATHKIYCDSV